MYKQRLRISYVTYRYLYQTANRLLISSETEICHGAIHFWCPANMLSKSCCFK